MRSVLFVAVLIGCKGEPLRPDAPDKPTLDAYNPPWFHPIPGEIKNWDIQLAAPYDFTVARQLYVVPLFDVVPAQTTLDYGDGAPVTVPAGAQPTAIATIKAAGAKVICHAGIGAIELTDPDAVKFPGYDANHAQIPDKPTPPAAGSVIGWSTSPTNANERYLDVRAGGRAVFEKYILKRLELAKNIGCDGVLGHGNDAAVTEDKGGFGITSEDNIQLVAPLVRRAHELVIALGGRGGHALPGVENLRDDYDFLVAERCTEIPDCDRTRPFVEYERAVLGLDYDIKANGNPSLKDLICQEWTKDKVDGVIKRAALDGGFRDSCP